MYETLPDDIRDRHPYYMYEEIRAQPEAVARALDGVRATGAEARDAVARARRVFVTGCGTSYHAAKVGASLLRGLSRGGVEAWPVRAFELVNYFSGLRPDDAVVAVSHSGTSFMTLRTLEAAGSAGAETVAVTGFPASEAGRLARHVVPTGYEQERSWAHTISYLAALTCLAAIANDLAGPQERLDLGYLPEAVAEALQLEELAHRLAASTLVAERYREPPPILLVGSGPNVATAEEGALKLLETSYVQAAPFELEQMLHGPLAAVSDDTLFFLLAPGGQSTERAAELARAVRQLDIVPVVLTGEESAGAFDGSHRFLLPDVPEILSPIPYVLPLQLFAYFLAVGKGINPDLIHRDDERQRTARAQYR